MLTKSMGHDGRLCCMYGRENYDLTFRRPVRVIGMSSNLLPIVYILQCNWQRVYYRSCLLLDEIAHPIPVHWNNPLPISRDVA